MDHTENEPDSSGISGNESREVNRAPHPQNSESGSGLNEIHGRVSAQRQVLENEDLLDIIFASICNPRAGNEITGGSNDTGMKNLLWTSLTCKQFFDPAIDIIWRSMKSWAPLLRLIPSVVESDGNFITRSAVSGEHFERFMFYAKRILEFDLTSEAELNNLPRVAPHLYGFLGHHRQLDNFSFPLLQFLMVDLSLIRPDDIHMLYLLPSLALANIVRLKWDEETEGHAASSFLRILARRSPALVTLSLEGVLSDDILDAKNAHAFNFPKLRDITLNFNRSGCKVQFQLWAQQLASLESLKSLSITTTDVGQAIVTSKDVHIFSNLTTLNIEGPREEVLRILRQIRALRLTKLNVTFKGNRKTSIKIRSSQESGVNTIVGISGSLESLSLDSFGSKGLIPSSLFVNFMKGSSDRLRRLMLCLDFDIDKVLEAAARWNCIEDLGFYPPREAPQSPMLLSSIEKLASCFPKLRSLSIPVSFQMTAETVEFMKTRIARVGPTSHSLGLQKLHLWPISSLRKFTDFNSPQRKAEYARLYGPDTADYVGLFVVCQYIGCIFPKLRHISAKSWYVDAAWLKGLVHGIKEFQKT